MNSFSKLRQQHGLSVEDMAKILVMQPSTLQRYEYGDFDHVPEIKAELRRRLMALGWLDHTESAAAA